MKSISPKDQLVGGGLVGVTNGIKLIGDVTIMMSLKIIANYNQSLMKWVLICHL